MEKKLEFTESAKSQIEKITKSDNKKKYFRIAVQGADVRALNITLVLMINLKKMMFFLTRQ